MQVEKILVEFFCFDIFKKFHNCIRSALRSKRLSFRMKNVRETCHYGSYV